MESWRRIWRDGFSPNISDRALLVLRDALASDSPKLVQEATTVPAPLMAVQDWPVEAACPVGLCGWAESDPGLGDVTVGAVEEYFAKRCFDADQLLREAAGCRWFLNWWDETPRPRAVSDLLAEVNYNLGLRAEAGCRVMPDPCAAAAV